MSTQRARHQTLRAGRVLAIVAGIGVLAGCSQSSHDELQQWITEQRNATKPRVQPIPEPKQFTPQPYEVGATTDPFNRDKLTQALKRDSTQTATNAALIAPELNRRKEALEAYPLDVMVMVGSLVQRDSSGKPVPVALLRVDNLLHQVRVGNYIGQNYGKITRISESEVVLREIVQDPGGEWIERTATLQLQERAK